MGENNQQEKKKHDKVIHQSRFHYVESVILQH